MSGNGRAIGSDLKAVDAYELGPADYAEIPELERNGYLSGSRFGHARYLRSDHFGPVREPLEATIRNTIRTETTLEPDGPIRLLTQLRTWGYYFSPLNLFFCFERDGETLQAIVAEVQNTPWKERHCYVLWQGNRDEQTGQYRHEKAFHVSPFLPMELSYRWRTATPSEMINVSIQNFDDNRELFRAMMNLRKIPWTKPNMRRLLARHPFMPLQIVAAIHIQAFKLWRKKCPFFAHPKHRSEKSMKEKLSPLAQAFSIANTRERSSDG